MSMLYRRLDTLRERTQAELERALGYEGGGNVQARVDRDAFVARHSGRLAQLAAAEHGLCFGRLDRSDGSHLYIGRIGLLDDDREPLLVDWRAPAAQPFYRATSAAPSGVVRRRHLRTRGRQVIGIDDDVLDLDSLSDAERARASAARPPCWPPSRPAAPAGWATSSPPSRPSRTGSSAPTSTASWSSRAGRAPARPPWPCTGPPTCSTPTASAWPAGACWSSGPTRPSCATSSRCCPRWARPTCCCRPSATCSRA